MENCRQLGSRTQSIRIVAIDLRPRGCGGEFGDQPLPPVFTATVLAQDVRRNPVQPWQGTLTISQVPGPVLERDPEDVTREAVGSVSTGAPAQVAVNLVDVPVEDRPEELRAADRSLDYQRVCVVGGHPQLIVQDGAQVRASFKIRNRLNTGPRQHHQCAGRQWQSPRAVTRVRQLHTGTDSAFQETAGRQQHVAPQEMRRSPRPYRNEWPHYGAGVIRRSDSAPRRLPDVSEVAAVDYRYQWNGRAGPRLERSGRRSSRWTLAQFEDAARHSRAVLTDRRAEGYLGAHPAKAARRPPDTRAAGGGRLLPTALSSTVATFSQAGGIRQCCTPTTDRGRSRKLARETDNHGRHHVRRFALATYQPALEQGVSDDELIEQLAKALIWLIERRGPEGIWPGENPEDRFESTYHACQTLLMLGVRPESTLLYAPLQWLVDFDAASVPYHFWRAGTLLNINDYDRTVADDLEYIWKHRKRVVGYRDYPAMVFLLKCSLFVYNGTLVPAPIGEIVKLVVTQWDDDECWFDRTSITSMAYALLLDQDFPDKETILRRSRSFLLSRFAERASRPSFDANLVDDCYTIYNLCEQPGLLDFDPELLDVVTQCAEGIRSAQEANSTWSSPSPFHGHDQIGRYIQPTAVAVRALAAHAYRVDEMIIAALRARLLEIALSALPQT